jgi:hypothetical protein
MRNIVLAFIASLCLLSCGNYQQSSVAPDYISSLNKALRDGQQNGAIWANSPEEIARHLYPPVSHDGRSNLYKVTKKTNSSTDCTVTVVEEGSIDDEVLGERHTLYFRNSDGRWTIVDLKTEIKRRP